MIAPGFSLGPKRRTGFSGHSTIRLAKLLINLPFIITCKKIDAFYVFYKIIHSVNMRGFYVIRCVQYSVWVVGF